MFCFFFAFSFCYELQYSYSLYRHTAEITGVSGQASGTLVIPETVEYNGDTYFVTSIGDKAFKSRSGFTGSLTIPNSVTSIGFSAFSYCSGFTGSLTIPNSVTSIGSSAFYCCSGFKGSCLAFIDPKYTDKVLKKVEEEYLNVYPKLKNKYSAHICSTADGIKL